MDTNRDYEEKLKLERAKLDKLVDEALEKGTPLSETHEIMRQSRIVNEMIQKAEEQKKRRQQKESAR